MPTALTVAPAAVISARHRRCQAMSTITVSGRKKLISPSRTLTGMKRMVSRISLVAVRTSRVTASVVEEA